MNAPLSLQAQALWRAQMFARVPNHPKRDRAIRILRGLVAEGRPQIRQRALNVLEIIRNEQRTRDN